MKKNINSRLDYSQKCVYLEYSWERHVEIDDWISALYYIIIYTYNTGAVYLQRAIYLLQYILYICTTVRYSNKRKNQIETYMSASHDMCV